MLMYFTLFLVTTDLGALGNIIHCKCAKIIDAFQQIDTFYVIVIKERQGKCHCAMDKLLLE